MSRTTVSLQQANETTLPYVESLLDRNDLPSRDVRSKLECFYVGYDEGEAIGIGGIEAYERDGLLRSVVVEQSFRGRGFGDTICEALEEEARTEDIERLFLLTTTAARFFAERGYEEIDRDEAPESVQRTTEFTDLCPATATCMRKSL